MATTRRTATLDDTAALLGMYEAFDAIEFGAPEIELDDITDMLTREDGEHVLVEDSGRVIGYADITAGGEVETLVDPRYDGARDLHRELLAWVVERGTERGLGRLEHWAGTAADGAAPVLAEAGFAHARTLWRMTRTVDGAVPEPVWPAGVELRAFDRERDAREVWQVVQTSFDGTFGSHRRSFEEWSSMVLDRYVPLCAVEAGAIVGVATTSVRSEAGHVGQLAVLPGQRGRGIALALLLECFRRDTERDLPATRLTVDGENASARRLYEKAGMSVAGEYRRWERDV